MTVKSQLSIVLLYQFVYFVLVTKKLFGILKIKGIVKEQRLMMLKVNYVS